MLRVCFDFFSLSSLVLYIGTHTHTPQTHTYTHIGTYGRRTSTTASFPFGYDNMRVWNGSAKMTISNGCECYVRVIKISKTSRTIVGTTQCAAMWSDGPPQFVDSVIMEISRREVYTCDLRFEVCVRNEDRSEDYVRLRFQLPASSFLCRPIGTELVMCGHGSMRLLVQTLPSLFSCVSTLRLSRPMARSYVMHSARRLKRLLVREEIHEVETSYSIPSMFLKLRCEELRQHKKKTLNAWKTGLETRNNRASRAGSLTGRIPSSKYEAEENPIPDEEFQENYIRSIDRMIQRYEDLSARYEHRHRYCVPFRASKQKAQPAWIRAVPLNLHLSMLSVASYCRHNVEEEKEEEEEVPATPPPPPTPGVTTTTTSLSRKNSLPRKIFVKLPRIGASLGVQYVLCFHTHLSLSLSLTPHSFNTHSNTHTHT